VKIPPNSVKRQVIIPFYRIKKALLNLLGELELQEETD
jgi:hypothetical protein